MEHILTFFSHTVSPHNPQPITHIVHHASRRTYTIHHDEKLNVKAHDHNPKISSQSQSEPIALQEIDI